MPDSFAQGGGTNLETMVMVKDGSNQLLVGGLFNSTEGQADYQGVARYKTDDSLDTAFKVKTDEFVKAIAVQSDGKILIGGQFHWVTPFNGADAWVWAVLPDGNDKLYVGGIVRHGVARLIPGDASAASCNKIYLSQGEGGASRLYASPANLPVAFANLGQTGSTKTYNALGVNPTNKKLYGISGSNELVTVNAETGNVLVLDTPGLPAGSYNSGAFDNAGNYYVKPFGNNTALYKIDVSATPPTATLITLSTSLQTSDIPWVNTLMYTTVDNGQLYSIDVATGATTAIGAADNTGGVLGAQFSGTNGLFGSTNGGAGLYSIDLRTGKVTPVAPGECQIAADQAGGQNKDGVTYDPAARVTQSVTIQGAAPAPTPVPTLGPWALSLLAGLLGLMGLRRRKTL